MAVSGNPDFKTALSQALMDRLPALALQCQVYLDEALAQIAKESKYGAGTVLIVDSFEKLRGEGHNAEVRERKKRGSDAGLCIAESGIAAG